METERPSQSHICPPCCLTTHQLIFALTEFMDFMQLCTVPHLRCKHLELAATSDSSQMYFLLFLHHFESSIQSITNELHCFQTPCGLSSVRSCFVLIMNIPTQPYFSLILGSGARRNIHTSFPCFHSLLSPHTVSHKEANLRPECEFLMAIHYRWAGCCIQNGQHVCLLPFLLSQAGNQDHSGNCATLSNGGEREGSYT